MTGALAWCGVGLWLVGLFSAGWFWRGRWERRYRRRRRGGFMGLGLASDNGNPATVRRVRTYTGCWPGGQLREVTDRLHELGDASKTGALTFFGTATAGNPGAAEPPTIAPIDRPFAGGSFVAW